MRNDEQLIDDLVESTNSELADTAQQLYDAIGPSAVYDWAHRVGLHHSEHCVPCEADTPSIGNICAICWTVRDQPEKPIP